MILQSLYLTCAAKAHPRARSKQITHPYNSKRNSLLIRVNDEELKQSNVTNRSPFLFLIYTAGHHQQPWQRYKMDRVNQIHDMMRLNERQPQKKHSDNKEQRKLRKLEPKWSPFSILKIARFQINDSWKSLQLRQYLIFLRIWGSTYTPNENLPSIVTPNICNYGL